MDEHSEVQPDARAEAVGEAGRVRLARAARIDGRSRQRHARSVAAKRQSVAARLHRPCASLYGRRLLLLAHYTGLSLADVDRLAGTAIGQSHAFVERARDPRVGTIRGYAAVFGVSLAWFITGAGPRPHLRAIRAAVARARTDLAASERARAEAVAVAAAASAAAKQLRALAPEELEAVKAEVAAARGA